VAGGKPFTVPSQSISGVRAVNSSVAFDDVYGRKGEVLFFFLCLLPLRGQRVSGTYVRVYVIIKLLS
jgi:hypothetical protein